MRGASEAAHRATLGTAKPGDFMARWWNRLQSAVYTRAHWINELYARATSGRTAEIPLPPLAELRRPLPEARVGMVTAAGVHLIEQPGFDMDDPEGDASYRVIPADADVSALTITHDYYDHSAPDRDINCVYPIERLRELARAGELGEVAPRHVGMMGHIYGEQRNHLVREAAWEIAEVFERDGVDLVLATPG
jgi:D-proline reductase (dithiol) PrdB